MKSEPAEGECIECSKLKFSDTDNEVVSIECQPDIISFDPYEVQEPDEYDEVELRINEFTNSPTWYRCGKVSCQEELNSCNISDSILGKALTKGNAQDENFKSKFPFWFHLLKKGYNLLFYGSSVTPSLMDAFRKHMLSDCHCITVDGADSATSFEQVLEIITTKVVDSKNSLSSSTLNPLDAIKEHFEKGNSKDLYILISSIDKLSLNSKKSQSLLSQLTSVPGIHIVASADSINESPVHSRGIKTEACLKDIKSEVCIDGDSSSDESTSYPLNSNSHFTTCQMHLNSILKNSLHYGKRINIKRSGDSEKPLKKSKLTNTHQKFMDYYSSPSETEEPEEQDEAGEALDYSMSSACAISSPKDTTHPINYFDTGCLTNLSIAVQSTSSNDSLKEPTNPLELTPISDHSQSVHSTTSNDSVRDTDEDSNSDSESLKDHAVPLSKEEIVNLPIDHLNHFIETHDLTEDQVACIRDIRRRGKNKVAAQNCRRRKLDEICVLQEQVNCLQDELQKIRSLRNHLLSQRTFAIDICTRFCKFLQEAGVHTIPQNFLSEFEKSPLKMEVE